MSPSGVQLVYHVYQLDNEGPEQEDLAGDGEEPCSAATHWLLPSQEFHGLWDTLVYDTDVKNQVRIVVTRKISGAAHNGRQSNLLPI